MCENIFSDDSIQYKSTNEMAAYLYASHNKSYFLYEYKNQLYKCKAKDNGDLKVTNICTAFPKLINVINKGDAKEQKNHYLFRVYSNFLKDYFDVLMPAKDICSNTMFKKALLGVSGALFTGTKDDLDMFISATFNSYDFNK